MTDQTETTPPGEQTGATIGKIERRMCLNEIGKCFRCRQDIGYGNPEIVVPHVNGEGMGYLFCGDCFIDTVAPASAVLSAADRAALGRAARMYEEARANYVWRSVDREVAGKVERSGGDGPTQAELDRWERQATDRWSQEHPHFDADLAILRDLAAGGAGDD